MKSSMFLVVRFKKHEKVPRDKKSRVRYDIRPNAKLTLFYVSDGLLEVLAIVIFNQYYSQTASAG